MPFYRVHLNSGKTDILYAHTEDHAKTVALRKHGSEDSETQVMKVEYLQIAEA